MGKPAPNGRTRAFVLGLSILTAGLCLSLVAEHPPAPGDGLALAAFLSLAAYWSLLTFKVGARGGDAAALSLAPAALQAMVPVAGPAVVLVAGVVAGIIDWAAKRRRFYTGLFNIAAICAGLCAGIGLVHALGDEVPPGLPGLAVTAVLAALAFSVTNLVLTPIVLRLATGCSLRATGAWSSSALTNETVLCCFSALMALSWSVHPVALALSVVPLTLLFLVLSKLERREADLREEVAVRRRTEEDLRCAKDAAEAASRAKTAFLARTSHEIRTPMNGILGLTKLAIEARTEADRRDLLLEAGASSEALLGVLGQILEFAELDDGRIAVASAPFGLRERIVGAVRPFAPIAAAKDLVFSCRIAPDVPDQLVGDAPKLAQLIGVLCSNAVKFTDNGEVRVEVRRADDVPVPPGASLVLEFAVTDTGAGIPEAQCRAIFEAFVQGESYMTRRHGGTGLGLSIASRLAPLLGGTLGVESTPGAGSSFRISLPFATAPLVEPPLAGVRLLVVDSIESRGRACADMLRGWGSDAAWATPETVPDPAVEALLFSSDDARHARGGASAAGPVHVVLSAAGPAPIEAAHGPALVTDPPLPADIKDLLQRQGRQALDVLLVEDNAVNQKLAVRLLERAGHRVVVAGDGRAGVEAWSAGRFDVVLMDIQMPVMDGLAATAEIRRVEALRGLSRTPIVAVTAHVLPGDRSACQQAGMDEFVEKPVRAEALASAMRSAIERAARPVLA